MDRVTPSPPHAVTACPAAILRSSTLMTSKRRAISVEVFSAQSLSLSFSRTRSRAISSFTRARRCDPRRALASFRSSRRIRLRSWAVRPGAYSNSPVERAAETATPRSMPVTFPLPGAGIGSGMRAKTTCQRPARSIRRMPPSLGQSLPGLLQIPGSARAARMPVRVLLDGQVPHIPRMGAVAPQCHLLGRRGEQTVMRHANTITICTDIFGEVRRCPQQGGRGPKPRS
jgi:hypothetical protein